MTRRRQRKAMKIARRPPHTSPAIGEWNRSLSVQELLSTALEHYQTGHLHQTEATCRQILEVQANSADALYLLGRMAFQQGETNLAVEYISKAISVNGTNAAFHSDLGTVLTAQGKLDEAIVSYKQALAIKPDYADAHYNLGNVFTAQDRLDEAIASYQQALAIKPDYVDAHNNLGYALQAQGQLDIAIVSYKQALAIKPDYADAHYNLGNVSMAQDKLDLAIASYQQALAIKPDYADAHNNLGYALQAQGELDLAIVSYKQALAIKPDYADAHYNLGNVLTAQEKPDEAIASYQQALAIKPDYADAHYNLGNVLRTRGRLDEAIASYQQALAIKPDYTDAHYNLGNAFSDQNKLDAAIECYDRAIRLKPDYAQAHLNKALALLLSGNLAEGWLEHEWRPQVKEIEQQVAHFAPAPKKWDGSSLAGKNILILSEQGLGDTIHFVRYLPLVQAQASRVIFQCQRELVRLLDGFPGIDVLLEKSDIGYPDIAYDVYTPLLSLPGIFGTTIETIPAELPYIKANPEGIDLWRAELDCQDFKIGLAWTGNPKYKNDCNRSCSLNTFSPLAHIPGVTFCSLQKGSAGRRTPVPPEGLNLIDFEDKLEDFSETAALISSLDLVISVDTAVAHLAGAMAQQVWTLLPFNPDWRWLLRRSDSPWYPTMRLFRQPKPGDWDAVVQLVARELAKLVHPN